MNRRDFLRMAGLACAFACVPELAGRLATPVGANFVDVSWQELFGSPSSRVYRYTVTVVVPEREKHRFPQTP